MSKLTENEKTMFRIARIKISEDDSAAENKFNLPLDETVERKPQVLLESMRETSRETLNELEEENRLNQIMWRLAGFKNV